VPESAPLPVALDQLRAGQHELAIVVDEYGGISGILTLEDLVEELVGDFADEHDPVVAVEQVGERAWLVPGSWRIDEIERDTGVELPDSEEYDTVGGLVMDRLGRIPVVGDEVQVDGICIRVTEMGRRRVVGVHIEARP
jgi:CBS domain containing-hemolysin-like protein